MGSSVLAYQFVIGLVKELKAKLVGAKRTFEQFLEMARFEEARLRELGNLKSTKPENSIDPSREAKYSWRLQTGSHHGPQ